MKTSTEYNTREVLYVSESDRLITQINSLENGMGLQYLLNEGYKIFGNPFVLFNMEYELIACTENIVTDDWIWNEIVNNGVFCDETINFFKDEDFTDTGASTKTISLLTSDRLEYERMYARVVNCDNNTVADLIILACYKPFGDDDLEALEAYRSKLSKEINTTDFYRQYGIIYHESLIRKLLNKNSDDRIMFSDHVANLYEGLKNNLFVAVADVSRCNAINSDLENFRNLFKKTQVECKYAMFSGYIVIIVSTDEDELDVNRELGKLSVLFSSFNIYAGISGRFDNLFELRKHYDDAVNVLTRGLEVHSQKRFFSTKVECA